MLNFSTASYRK